MERSMNVSFDNLLRQTAFILAAISSAALLLWMIMIPADIAAVLVVFLAAVVIQFIVAIDIRMTRANIADETRIEHTRRVGGAQPSSRA
jgi:hypothetical protein